MAFKDPEATRTYQKAYRQANKDRLRIARAGYLKAYHAAHKEHLNGLQRVRRAANRLRSQAQYRADYAKHRERRRTVGLVRYYANREANLRAMHMYRARTTLQRQINRHAYHIAHKQEQNLLSRAYYAAHTQQINLRSRAYSATHREQCALYGVRRRSRQAGAQRNTLSVAQWREIKAAFNYRCAYCPPECPECRAKTHHLHREHVTPVIDAGDTHIWNIVPSCRSCNSRKGIKPPPKPVQPLLLTLAKPFKKKKTS